MVVLIQHIHKECDRQAASVVEFFKSETRIEERVRAVSAVLMSQSLAATKKEDEFVNSIDVYVCIAVRCAVFSNWIMFAWMKIFL